ncbi:Alpha/Beta hydrolase protein [Coniochaeta sp. 2T2.1]|nr:Alpha/Beta hydrolase protein [Coniochaeta sp. 2T2.1]
MFNFQLSYRYLFFRPPPHRPTPLPEGIERLFADTPPGKIEILYAAPKGEHADKNASPVFFVHGGMGSAWVWLEYMTYLSERGVPCYAVSMRGHGESWCPSYLRMVWLTTKRDLADDVVAGIRFAQAREGGNEVVLVGHSSGGGLSQFILSEGDVTAKGLTLMGAVPGFGSIGVYVNWWKVDPLFTIRMWFHLGHPNSPLSHPALTRRVFFHGAVSDAYMEEFQRHINPYECFRWPLSMMKPFTSFPRILGQISGWDEHGGARVMVLRGEYDRLMTLPVMEKLTGAFREAYRQLVRVTDKKIDWRREDEASFAGAGGEDTQADGVRFCCVPDAGHHMQNDVGWEVGAQKLLDFYEQL